MSRRAPDPDAERARVLLALPRLKIFPLPGAVLLPGATVPLHIFEPRYRKMTQDCAAGDGVLALAHLASGAVRPGALPRVLPILGAGVLDTVEPMPDGRFNVLLRGVLRARIREEHVTTDPYRSVLAEPLLDGDLDSEPAQVARVSEELRRLLLALCSARNDDEVAALARQAARASDAGQLADLAAGALLESPAERQAALEAVRVLQRLEIAKQAAATQLARVAPRTSQKGKLLN